jgi:ribosomal protein S18 acetylase RimI-like enzyme
MRERRASEYTADELTDLFNRGYEGYFIPFHFTVPMLEAHVRAGHIDLARSLVWEEEGRPIAFSLLGVRSGRGWIGGFAIAPEARGRRLADPLFQRHVDVIFAAGSEIRALQLEVFTENWARKTYERAGMRVTRRVEAFEGPLDPSRFAGDAAGGEAADGDVAALLAHHARLHAAWPATWNREDAYVAAYPFPVFALHAGPADAPTAVLFAAESGPGIRVLDAAATTDADAAAVFRALARRHPGRTMIVVNEAEDSPVNHVLRTAGFPVSRAQFEMHLVP